MSYGLYTASYGSYNADRQVSITDAASGLPALILGSALGGVVTNLGLTKLDSSGNLNVYIDLSRTWKVEVFEETFRENNSVNIVRALTVPELSTVIGELGITYIVRETNKQYFWDGTKLVPFPDRFQLSAIDSFSNQTFSSFTYDGSNRIQTYVRDGIAHTVNYPTSTQVVISNITGTSRTINLDSSGKVIAIL